MRTLGHAHPVTCFAYIVSVLGVTLFCRSPVILLLSLLGALGFSALSGGIRGAGWWLLTALVIAVTNPVFSHGGRTALFFMGDTAFTLEACAYGLAFGGMLAAAGLWGAGSARVFTSDKYVWLFSKVAPAVGLTLSCALRLLPVFVRRVRDFAGARRADSLKSYLGAFSAAVGYSLEESVEVAELMRARGYGTARRTFYSPCRFGKRDAAQLGFTAAFGVGSAVLACMGAGGFRYYPTLSVIRHGAFDMLFYFVFGILCAAPSAVAVYEEILRTSAGRGKNADRG